MTSGGAGDHAGQSRRDRTREKIDVDAATIRARQNHAPAPIEAEPASLGFFPAHGHSCRHLAALYAFWLSLAFELGAMFSMMLATAIPWRKRRRQRSPSMPGCRATRNRSRPISSPPMRRASTASFWRACRATRAARHHGWNIFKQYVGWCTKQGIAALDVDAFGERFAATCRRVGIPVRRRGGQAWCVDVGLVA